MPLLACLPEEPKEGINHIHQSNGLANCNHKYTRTRGRSAGPREPASAPLGHGCAGVFVPISGGSAAHRSLAASFSPTSPLGAARRLCAAAGLSGRGRRGGLRLSRHRHRGGVCATAIGARSCCCGGGTRRWLRRPRARVEGGRRESWHVGLTIGSVLSETCLTTTE